MTPGRSNNMPSRECEDAAAGAGLQEVGQIAPGPDYDFVKESKVSHVASRISSMLLLHTQITGVIECFVIPKSVL